MCKGTWTAGVNSEAVRPGSLRIRLGARVRGRRPDVGHRDGRAPAEHLDPVDQQRELVTGALDAYCNAFLRSVKAERRSNHLAALLQASRSIDLLLLALFALHERFTPFVEYLAAEVPLLTKLPWRDGLLDRLAVIAATADVTMQQGLERDVEHLVRQEGYGAVFDAWEQTAGARWHASLDPA